MRMVDLIDKKKNNNKLSKEEIKWIIDGYTNGDIPDYQMSAFLMAVCFNGLDDEETLNLTLSMRDSGVILDLSSIKGVKVDKHSSGGVGDKTTLTLAPLMAACGVSVAKMSGRGLGHTGGTIDKLESFPGFKTGISEDQFFKNVNKNGLVVAGQTANLAPADKKIYALRDTTATVAQSSLIASSIMSKKLASGSDAIVLDVKCGSGAFMKSLDEAEELATKMVKIGSGAGKKTIALITNMNQPLGYAVGNILEVIEAVEALKGNGPKDYIDLVNALGCQMILAANLAENEDKAQEMIDEAISSGKALDKFADFIEAQGGNRDDAYNPEGLLNVSIVKELIAKEEGYITSINAEDVGRACMILGGGRATKEDVIDLSVGIVLNKKVGQYVKAGEPLAKIYANDLDKLNEAYDLLFSSYTISRSSCEDLPTVYKIIKE